MPAEVRIKAGGPGPQRLEPRRLRRSQRRRIQVALVLPDSDVIRQSTFGDAQLLGEVTAVFSYPVAREDVRPGVGDRRGTPRDHPNSVAGVFAVEADADPRPVDLDRVQGVAFAVLPLGPAPPEADLGRPGRLVARLP